jgi:hypothetical protein
MTIAGFDFLSRHFIEACRFVQGIFAAPHDRSPNV